MTKLTANLVKLNYLNDDYHQNTVNISSKKKQIRNESAFEVVAKSRIELPTSGL